MKSIILFFFLFVTLLNSCVSSTEESGVNGRIIRLDSFPSTLIGSRAIDVWLPADYDSSKQYAVIYMHNAQMLFDSTTTWNKKEWQMDETMTKLLKEQKIKDAIVVGIENSTDRGAGDYFPDAILPDIPDTFKNIVMNNYLENDATGDEYLMFIVLELRPYIDSTYSTYGDYANTFMMGSSMGAIISLYAICEYPKIFGGVACLSTHWPMDNPAERLSFDMFPSFRQYLDDYLPPPADHKIYFDLGTETLDSIYKPYQTLVDSIMVKHGYNASNWVTKEFPGDEHSETSWAKRLHYPIEFLLKKE